MKNFLQTHRQRILTGFRTLVVITVCAFVVRAFLGTREQLTSENSISIRDLRFGWLAVAAFLYLVGVLPMAIYWHRMLKQFGQSPTFMDTLCAYYIGHLGKYVPGKAMVVVIRAGLLGGGPSANTTVTAVSVFAETLTMMAVGAFVAAAIIAWSFAEHTWLLIIAIGLMLAAGIPTWPPVFRWLVRQLRVAKLEPDVERAIEGFSLRLMLFGWGANLLGWLVLGLSFWATLRAIPMDPPLASPLELGPRLTASVCLAVVAGFLSLIPGGIGVREIVLDELMAEPFGRTIALISAVLLRLVWLMTELAFSGILYLWIRLRRGH